MSEFDEAVLDEALTESEGLPDKRSDASSQAAVHFDAKAPQDSVEHGDEPRPGMSANLIAMTLQAMAGAGMANYAPVRFRYLQAMAKRVCASPANAPGSHSLGLANKLTAALTQYQQEFIAAYQCGVGQLETINEQFPESADLAEGYFRRYEFIALQKLLEMLQHRTETRSVSLSDVTNSLLKGLSEDAGDTWLDDSLLQQEQETMHAVLAQSGVTDGAKTAQLAAMELSSVRRFRDSCVKIHSHKVVNKALDDRPENPGPLNPQMLTIRSLSLLRKLSPEYLKRFVSYIDTMLWLEQSGAKTAPSKKSKTAK